MSRLKPRAPAVCAACRVLPAVDGSVMCQGCRNWSRRLVAAFMGRRGEVLVRGPVRQL